MSEEITLQELMQQAWDKAGPASEIMVSEAMLVSLLAQAGKTPAEIKKYLEDAKDRVIVEPILEKGCTGCGVMGVMLRGSLCDEQLCCICGGWQ